MKKTMKEHKLQNIMSSEQIEFIEIHPLMECEVFLCSIETYFSLGNFLTCVKLYVLFEWN